MNKTPRANRLHIALFGRRNVGKSSLINALTGQEVAVVSEIAGTTTDPVYKGMEVLPLGPVVFIDTAGIDDVGQLGELRIEKTKEVLRKTDIGIIVTSREAEWGREEEDLIRQLKGRKIPFIIAVNKEDSGQGAKDFINDDRFKDYSVVGVSALTGEGIEDLIKELVKLQKKEDNRLHLVDDLVEKGDLIILVTPLDKAAPKGRLILPQQQVLRDVLDNGAMAMMVRDTELKEALSSLQKPPKIVITDSQVFDKVDKILPEDIALTSFSIIFAREKGDLDLFHKAVKEIEKLEDGDLILMAEGCTHHRKEDDIGTVQIPKLLKKVTGKDLHFHHVAGGFFKEDLSKYKLVVHCGACMLTRREMEYRQVFSMESGVPMLNYGIILAYLHGILERSMVPFKDISL